VSERLSENECLDLYEMAIIDRKMTYFCSLLLGRRRRKLTMIIERNTEYISVTMYVCQPIKNILSSFSDRKESE
jgi:hypothetical protein